ncbi:MULTISPECIES: ABC transporter ATP-binding protein [Massilia]|jgi:ABC-2 type transport system ATP-binding protein|uniref:ATP-binding cassette domain-containing protein n=2 Tax=Massilia TaxID=149698 RepID=A0A7X3G6P4_9BURK|nr:MULTISPECIES: ABC transporter ATP-binding protein [Telluria group]KQY18586.1 ABC transporter [Massilia sp. Root133]KQZ53862.1 ABC transporter [Massilia sp. Root1485]MDN4041738.1 ABC transporter ATP-binding protein [Massilia sp. YIM B02787]MVW64558.1 ATP-binding cassette domain-containing protein [Telluria cellulosilytica]
MNSESPALRLSGLRKSFGRPAVDGLDLTVRRGELYALLGPNGAGKTTTLRMVTGLLAPDAGDVQVLGIDLARDPAGAKRGMAYLPDDPLLYGKLRPTEYLEFVAGLWGIRAQDAEPRARRLLDWLDLTKHAHELTEGFSRGMKQKLALAGALIHEPELLILDEPLTGLDAAAARQVKDLLVSHVEQGGTVILTTHILEVAERLAQRIGIIRQGRLIAEGTLAELRERTQGGSLEDVFLHLTEGQPG